MNIIEAARDPSLFARWFERGDWSAWFSFLAAIFGLPMDDDQRAIYQRCTGRTEPPSDESNETYLITGRRGGKSFITALIATYLACFYDYRPYLQPGERGTVLILASDRKQARVIFRYVRALIAEVPMLAGLLERETTESLDLTNGVSIEIATASYKSTRGYAVVSALMDEVGHWGLDGEKDPQEIINALLPGMATIPNAKLIALSSPFSKQGPLYDAYRQYYGIDDAPVLVWQSDTRTMNPTVPERVIEQAYNRDYAAAQAEFGGLFRDDLEQFIGRDILDHCTRPDPVEVPPISTNRYAAFVDPSGGSGQDSMTLSIAHREGEAVVIDMVREIRPPFSPADAVVEFVDVLKSYRCRKVTGDRYGGDWVREPFDKAGIEYVLADRPRSDLYRDVLPLINSGNVELPPMEKALRQFTNLQRRKSRTGKEQIDHPATTGAHDDLANAIAGAACVTAHTRRHVPISAWL